MIENLILFLSDPKPNRTTDTDINSVWVEYLGYEEDTRCVLSRHALHPVPHKRSRLLLLYQAI